MAAGDRGVLAAMKKVVVATMTAAVTAGAPSVAG